MEVRERGEGGSKRETEEKVEVREQEEEKKIFTLICT